MNHRRAVVVDDRVGIEGRLTAGVVAVQRHAGLRADIVATGAGVRIDAGCQRAVRQVRRVAHEVHREDAEIGIRKRAGAGAKPAPRRIR